MNEENVHWRIPQALKTPQPRCLTVVGCRFHSYLRCSHIPSHDISLSLFVWVSDAAPRGPHRWPYPGKKVALTVNYVKLTNDHQTCCRTEEKGPWSDDPRTYIIWVRQISMRFWLVSYPLTRSDSHWFHILQLGMENLRLYNVQSLLPSLLALTIAWATVVACFSKAATPYWVDNKNSGKLGPAAAAAKFSHQLEGTLKFWESHGLDVPVSHAPHSSELSLPLPMSRVAYPLCSHASL